MESMYINWKKLKKQTNSFCIIFLLLAKITLRVSSLIENTSPTKINYFNCLYIFSVKIFLLFQNLHHYYNYNLLLY